MAQADSSSILLCLESFYSRAFHCSSYSLGPHEARLGSGTISRRSRVWFQDASCARTASWKMNRARAKELPTSLMATSGMGSHQATTNSTACLPSRAERAHRRYARGQGA
eukprot:2007675-Prymnesium_polylepis.1